MAGDTKMICPFCEEGVLLKKKCKKCKNFFLMCHECESVYKSTDNNGEEFIAGRCPYCNTPAF